MSAHESTTGPDVLPTSTATAQEQNDEWMAATRHICDSLDKTSWIRQLAHSGTRLDGRLATSSRRVVVATNVLPKHSLGSAMVTMASDDSTANTIVLAGVTGCIGQPTTSPGGTVSVVLSSNNSSGNFKISSNNSGSAAIHNSNASLQSWLQRVVAPTIDPLSLVVEGAFMNQQIQAWGCTVTIVVLQDQGSVDDAALLAAMAALQHTVLPAVTFGTDGRVMTLAMGEDTSAVVVTGRTVLPPRPLTIQVWPIPLTLGRVDPLPPSSRDDINKDENSNDNGKTKDVWLADPSKNEEAACQARLTVVVNGYDTRSKKNDKASSAHGNNDVDSDVLSVEHRGGGLPLSTLALAIHMARGRAQELMPLLTFVDKRE